MAKKRRSNTDELREEFSRQLSAATRSLSRKLVAEKLEISRQMLNLYLRGKATPGGEVIERACAEWKLELTIKGNKFTGGAFKMDQPRGDDAAQQLSLLDLLDRLRNDQVEAKIISRKGGVFMLCLEIKDVA